MKKKALYALILALMMTGCGSKGKTASTAAPAPASGAESAAAAVPEPTEEAAVPAQNLSEAAESEAETVPDELPAIPAEEIELDDDVEAESDEYPDVSFTVKEYGTDEDGFYMTVELENESDRSISWQLLQVSLNDLMCDPYWEYITDPGEETETTIFWFNDLLEESHVGDVTKVQFDLVAADAEDWEAEYFINGRYVFYPEGKDASRSDRGDVLDGDVLFNRDFGSMTVVDTEEEDGVLLMTVYLENRTEKSLAFSANNVAVNGYICDPYWMEEIGPGSGAYSVLAWDEDMLAEYDLTAGDVTQIDLPLRVFDQGDLNADFLLEETISYRID